MVSQPSIMLNNKATPTGQLIKDRNLFLITLELECRSGCQRGQDLVRASVQGCRLPTSCCSPRWCDKSKRDHWHPFYQGTVPFYEGPTLMTQLPPKGPLPNTSALRFRISTYEPGGMQTFSILQMGILTSSRREKC